MYSVEAEKSKFEQTKNLAKLCALLMFRDQALEIIESQDSLTHSKEQISMRQENIKQGS